MSCKTLSRHISFHSRRDQIFLILCKDLYEVPVNITFTTRSTVGRILVTHLDRRYGLRFGGLRNLGESLKLGCVREGEGDSRSCSCYAGYCFHVF